MSEWLKGIIVGFILAVIWDIFKSKRDETKKEKQILLFLKEELKYNLYVASQNVDLIIEDLKSIGNNSGIVNPLITLKTGFWDLIKFHLPKRIAEGDMLKNFSEVARYTETISETIKNRENFKIFNRISPNYGLILKAYDEILIKEFSELVELMKKLPAFLELF